MDIGVATNISKQLQESMNFTFYHLLKDKSEEEIRAELAEKGWSDVQHQNEAFEAIGGYQDAVTLNRIK